MALFKKDVLQTAEKLVQKGKIEAAIKEYKKVVAKTPGDTNTLNRVGDLYVRLRKHADAVEYYMKTAERYALDGFYVKAIAVYKKVQRIDPGTVEVHGRLADLYAKQGLINEARTHLNQLADHHLRNNDTPAAISVYERIVDLDKDNPTPILRLADLYRENQQLSKATESYERIASLMLDRGQVDHAVQVYERALKIESDNLDFVRQAVLKIKDEGGSDRALDLLSRAEKLNPAASELRELVSPSTGDSDDNSGGLAPIEEVEKLPTSAFVPPTIRKPEPPPAPVPPAPEQEASGVSTGSTGNTGSTGSDVDLRASDAFTVEAVEASDEIDETASPAFVDPSSFSDQPEVETSSAPLSSALDTSMGSEESSSDVAPPMEPFALRGRKSSFSDLATSVPGAPTLEHSGEQGTASASPESASPESDAPEDQAPPIEALSDSGEIDLGEIGEIDEVVSAIEVEGEDEWSSSSDGRDLGAEFDRQVDPGPIDLGRDASSEVPALEVSSESPGSLESAGEAEIELEVEEPAPASDPRHAGLEEKMSEASVFQKYGLLDKALDRLNEVLAAVPDHIEALSQAIQVLVERGDEARASTKAETLHLLCAQRNERDRWEEIKELLESEGYQIDGDRVRTPGELSVSEEADEDAGATVADPYDQDPDAEDAIVEGDFSALTSKSSDSGPSGAADDPTGEVASADESTPSWLDSEDPAESDQAENLFNDEEEFFDLAAEMQDELGTDLSDLEESLPENAAEQSLEEIVEGFKQGVADNISEEESDTHYNLGIAYREMMLLDEAISEFQISAKSDDYLIDSCAMLGLCFREKGLPDLAAKWYLRAVEAPQLEDEQRVGMLYELADSLEANGDLAEAKNRFIQVASQNDEYRDVRSRLEALDS